MEISNELKLIREATENGVNYIASVRDREAAGWVKATTAANEVNRQQVIDNTKNNLNLIHDAHERATAAIYEAQQRAVKLINAGLSAIEEKHNASIALIQAKADAEIANIRAVLDAEMGRGTGPGH